jgi:hypothetical protein
MSDEGRTARSGGHQIVEHYCEFDGCKEWGCYGFEESRTVTRWFCSEHQPRRYRGLPRHGEARLAAAEIADMLK